MFELQVKVFSAPSGSSCNLMVITWERLPRKQRGICTELLHTSIVTCTVFTLPEKSAAPGDQHCCVIHLLRLKRLLCF